MRDTLARMLVCAAATSCICGLARAHDLLDLFGKAEDPVYVAAAGQIDASALSEERKNALRAILQADSRWTKPVVTVCFGPSAAVEARANLVRRITAISKEWLAATALTFDFGEKAGNASGIYVCAPEARHDIRVALDRTNEYLSIVGNTSAAVDLQRAPGYSMSLGFPIGWEDRAELAGPIRFYVLHEFGHALGFLHEHQRLDCEFDTQYLASILGVTEKFIADQLAPIRQLRLLPYPAPPEVADRSAEYFWTQLDLYSVMRYNLNRYVNRGDDPLVFKTRKQSPCYRDKYVSDLSDLDRAAAIDAYRRGAPIAALAQLLAIVKQDSPFAFLPPSIQAHLSSPRLGRQDFGEFAAMDLTPGVVGLRVPALPMTPNSLGIASNPGRMEKEFKVSADVMDVQSREVLTRALQAKAQAIARWGFRPAETLPD